MVRYCNGEDPNLRMDVDTRTGERLSRPKKIEAQFIESKPCDCGKVFDDVNVMTIYPHWPV